MHTRTAQPILVTADSRGRDLVPESFTDRDLNWYAVYTRSRHEKMVNQCLGERHIESFLPVQDVLSQWKDRRKWIQRPLFPGYLFVRADRSHLYQVRMTRGVSYIVGNGWARSPVPVPDEQVQAIRRMVEQEYPVMQWPLLRKGTRVRVTAGPLAGVETYIVERRNNKKSYLVVTVELLGRSVAVEIDPYCVEVVS